MWNVTNISKLIELDKIVWEEKETIPELFQYNFYMRFFTIIDIDENNFKNNNNYKIMKNINSEIWKEMPSLINYLAHKYNKNVGGISLIKLEPQEYPLRQYYDFEDYENIITKCYIPVVTNEKSNLCIDDKIYSLKPGEDINIDNNSLYSLYNFGDAPIVYLIVDLIND